LEDAFDAVVATAMFLVAAALLLQSIASALTTQSSEVVTQIYEQQTAFQLMLQIGSNQLGWVKLASAPPKTIYSQNSTVLAFNDASVILQPPFSVAGELVLVDNSLNSTAWTKTLTLGSSPLFSSCYSLYRQLSDGTLLTVEVCLKS
jgi:hypothetical protein